MWPMSFFQIPSLRYDLRLDLRRICGSWTGRQDGMVAELFVETGVSQMVIPRRVVYSTLANFGRIAIEN